MTEKEKMLAGMIYDANYNEELAEERRKAKDLCYEYNQIYPSQEEKQREVMMASTTKSFMNTTVRADFW